MVPTPEIQHRSKLLWLIHQHFSSKNKKSALKTFDESLTLRSADFARSGCSCASFCPCGCLRVRMIF
jgi:hypothetical protein